MAMMSEGQKEGSIVDDHTVQLYELLQFWREPMKMIQDRTSLPKILQVFCLRITFCCTCTVIIVCTRTVQLISTTGNHHPRDITT